MLVTEFMVALFPTAQLCDCSSSIYFYGDYLLGCSYGPLRIRRHDALTHILFHSIMLDNPAWLLVIISPDPVICTIQISAKVVQLSSMFLSATLSLSIIFQASVSVGAAATATESLKDKQHEANVVAAELSICL